MEDLEYIKKFSKINITKACKMAKVNRTNLLLGRTKEKNIKKVKKILESEVAKLYLVEDNKDE